MNIGPVSNQSPQQLGEGSSFKLSNDTLSFIKESFGFKGVKVVSVEKGTASVDGLKVLQHLDDINTPLLTELAKLADPNVDLSSVMVVLGGQELMKEHLKELEKSKKKIRQEQIKEQLKDLGLATDKDIIYFPPNETMPGGILLLQSGLEELEENE